MTPPQTPSPDVLVERIDNMRDSQAEFRTEVREEFQSLRDELRSRDGGFVTRDAYAADREGDAKADKDRDRRITGLEVAPGKRRSELIAWAALAVAIVTVLIAVFNH